MYHYIFLRLIRFFGKLKINQKALKEILESTLWK